MKKFKNGEDVIIATTDTIAQLLDIFKKDKTPADLGDEDQESEVITDILKE